MKTDAQLIKKIKDGDSDSFNEVCEKYENIFYKICQRYCSALTSCGINPQDIFDEKNLIILNCIHSFNPKKKTKLSTHIGNYARYLCLNSMHSRKFIVPTTSEELHKAIEDNQVKTEYLSNSLKRKETYDYVLSLTEQLKDKRIERILSLRYLGPKKMTWNSISKEMGISTQTAINLHNRGMSLIRKKIKSSTISDQI